MAPKKSIKMDLGSFLKDDTFGGNSWADEEVDMNSIAFSIENPTASTEAPIGGAPIFSGVGGGRGAMGGERRERIKYPVPDHPPFRAHVTNLPWEITEEKVVRHFEDRMQAKDCITECKLPVDRETGQIRGSAFLTFTSRAFLEESLNLSATDFLGRIMYVNVAQPINDRFGERRGEMGVELDWGAARGSRVELPPRERSFRGEGHNREFKPKREEPDLDWGSARGSQVELPPRERFNRTSSFGDSHHHHKDGESNFARTPRREEPDLDWGAVRGSQAELPPRERSFRGEGHNREFKPKREEPDLDWGSARGSQVELPPRERFNRTSSFGDSHHHHKDGESNFARTPRREEPDLDWGAVRGSQAELPPRERSFRGEGHNREFKPKREEPDLDWGSARGSQVELPPRERSNRKSSFNSNNNNNNSSEQHNHTRTPKSEEPDLDWSSARTTQAELPPREKSNRKASYGENHHNNNGEQHNRTRTSRTEKQDLDWSSARGTQADLPLRERPNRSFSHNNSHNTNGKQSSDSGLEWKRGQSLPQRTTKPSSSQQHISNKRNKDDKKKAEEKQGPQKSQFSVLSLDDDDEEEEEEEEEEELKEEHDVNEGEIEKLESDTAKLTVAEDKLK
ncbi:TIF3 [Candida oxycetoniae]|uniref:TIF3 n=1 Tax=Candida oxycetoniae TaxID=497107 RepID=A0AAI9SWU4_9ASCO|nr:TIF3 [Candida oxycetoniae]KAI3404210.2 TIF3 [Candida oxycetoniae]